MKKRCLLTIAALLFGWARDLDAQPDSLVDVFPLAVGNRWTYRYFTFFDYAPVGTPVETRTDSGLVVYSLTGSMLNADSTRWQFTVRRDLLRHQIFWLEGRDTTYPVRDSSFLDLIEKNNGQHQVYRNADPHLIRHDIFPFTRNYVDTTLNLPVQKSWDGRYYCVPIMAWPSTWFLFPQYIHVQKRCGTHT